MANLVELRELFISAETDSGRTIEIIKGVSFEIAPGEIVALIGESGSGKTTIALSLMGHTRPGCKIKAGEILVDGSDMAQLTEKACAERRGTLISYVPQSAAAAFNPSQSIMDQVIEISRIHGLMSDEIARKKAVELFHALTLPDPDNIGSRFPHQVSGGQLQRLSAAMALIGNPKLVIFDEPTTALDVTTQVDVLRSFKSVMKEGGMGGAYVSHDLAVVAQIADRIVVLKEGEVQEVGETEQILHKPKHPYTKELIAAFEPKSMRREVKPESVKPILDVCNVVAGYGPLHTNGLPTVLALNDVSLSLMPGKNLGIIGESGSGKSTLAHTIAGLRPPVSGKVTFDGDELAPSAQKRSKEELRRMQIVFQLADTALNPNKSVGSIIGRPLLFYHGLKGGAQQTRIDELLDMVRLPQALKHRLPEELSGGQKQRINLARALAAEPDLILCDEITSALDTVVAAAILDLLKELQSQLNLSYLFISHDLSTVQAICDQVIVMYDGEKVEAMHPIDMEQGAKHPYSRLLISSVPKMDTKWLDTLSIDANTAQNYKRS
tara:strand:+ start:639 stop:2294 length:1656 start_codon:yes stop_codon:yes gene_type:complete